MSVNRNQSDTDKERETKRPEGDDSWRPGERKRKTRPAEGAKKSARRKSQAASSGSFRSLIKGLYERDLLVPYAAMSLIALVIVVQLIAVLILENTSAVDEAALRAQLGAQKNASAQNAAEKKKEKEEKQEVKDPEVASFADGYRFKDEAEPSEDGFGSSYFVLVDVDKGEVVAKKDSKTVVPPASMTKILSLLVAVENLNEDKLKEKYEITSEISDYIIENDASAAGFETGEKVPVKDLLYGLILPSGADAAMALCDVVAGGQDEFVKLMNQRCEELGISETAHFTNPVGIYDEDLHCTCQDMAVILKAALENKDAREVLHAHKYTTSKTEQHPEGISLSNLFLRRIEDEELPGEVYGAKTGFVSQSGNCAASYLVSENKGHYICVTVNAQGAWNCIYSHRDIYNNYVK